MLIFGADPGGRRANGVAAFHVNEGGTALTQPPVLTTLAVGEDMVEWFIDRAGARMPTAIGIDTLTEWCTGAGGDRPADDWIRDLIRDQFGRRRRSGVLSPNALRGAMSTNGMSVLLRLRDKWPSLVVSETHPKALYRCVSGGAPNYAALHVLNSQLQKWPAMAGAIVGATTAHEWDAAVSAYAAWRGVANVWTLDLHALPNAAAHRHRVRPIGSTKYFWPTPQQIAAIATAMASATGRPRSDRRRWPPRSRRR